MSPQLIETTATRHVRGVTDIADIFDQILSDAIHLKHASEAGRLPQLLAGKAVLLLFEKNSTRTRVSFDIGVQRLGGMVSMIDAGTSQIARGESLEDTGAVLSRYADAIVYRAKDHASLTALAAHATVPVVNALTDLEHPCQILADWMTLKETWGRLKGRTFAYVGDGNNVCHSMMLAAPLAGMHLRVACPAGYAPDPAIVAKAQALAAKAGTKVFLTTDPVKAVTGADAVATDTWISMGDEAEEKARLAAFAAYTVDDAMMAQAKPDAVFLHCLPGHWGHEATYEVAHGPQSLIHDEAENRMWSQMALIVHLVGRRPRALSAA